MVDEDEGRMLPTVTYYSNWNGPKWLIIFIINIAYFIPDDKTNYKFISFDCKQIKQTIGNMQEYVALHTLENVNKFNKLLIKFRKRNFNNYVFFYTPAYHFICTRSYITSRFY